MVFADREHAGEILARLISKEKIDLKNALVAAIPRGGVVVGAKIAETLNIPLFPLVIKKLGAPQNPELAIGATASFGKPVLDRWLIAEVNVSGDYLKKEILAKKREAKAREKFLGIEVSEDKFKGKTVIVVDDGLATGQTARLATKILRQFGAKEIILAVPCAPASVVEQIKGEYDRIICPEIREDFMAVGQFYRDFRPVEDSEVKQIIRSVDRIG